MFPNLKPFRDKPLNIPLTLNFSVQPINKAHDLHAPQTTEWVRRGSVRVHFGFKSGSFAWPASSYINPALRECRPALMGRFILPRGPFVLPDALFPGPLRYIHFFLNSETLHHHCPFAPSVLPAPALSLPIFRSAQSSPVPLFFTLGLLSPLTSFLRSSQRFIFLPSPASWCLEAPTLPSPTFASDHL